MHAQLVVVWGANPAIANTHFPPLVQQARGNGAALVVVDPRRTGMAKRADLHLAVRPGTDVVLAMAVARELDRRGAVDRAFTDAHADGVDEYLGRLRGLDSLDRAAEVCGLDLADIVAFVDLLVERRPAFWRTGWGMERNRNGGSALRSVFALPVLTGAFGRAGCRASTCTPTTTCRGAPTRCATPSTGRRARPGRSSGAGPVATSTRTCSASCSPIRATSRRSGCCVVQGANPAVMNPAQAKVLAGLARDDLFTVVHDQVLTDTARYADVVLPATTHFESRDVVVPYGSFVGPRARRPSSIGWARAAPTTSSTPAWPPVSGWRPGPGEAFDPSPERLLALALPDGVPSRGRDPGAGLGGPVPRHLARPSRPPRPPAGRATAPRPTACPACPSTSARRRRCRSPWSRRPTRQDDQLDLRRHRAGRRRRCTSIPTTPPPAGSSTARPCGSPTESPTCSSPARRRRPAPRRGVDAQGPVALERRRRAHRQRLRPDTLNDLAGGACFNDARVDVVAV